MISAEDISFNGLMGKLEVPYRYHKILHAVVRNHKIPSGDLTDWLPVENAAEIWREVCKLYNGSDGQNLSNKGLRRSMAPPLDTGTPTSKSQTHSDPSIEPTPLGDDHPVYMLEESRNYCKELPEGEPIPFVVSKRRHENTRNVIIATNDKRRPDVPVKAQIQLREWDSLYAVWTIDINHTRFIVKNMGGAPNGGCKYNYWAGPNRGFEGPIAFSENSTARSARKTPFTEFVEVESGGEEVQEEQITDGTRSGRYFKPEIDIVDDPILQALQAESMGVNIPRRGLNSVNHRLSSNVEEDREIKVEPDLRRYSDNVTKMTPMPPSHPNQVSETSRGLQPLPAKRRKTDASVYVVDRVNIDSPAAKAPSRPNLARKPPANSRLREATQGPSSVMSQTNPASTSREPSSVAHPVHAQTRTTGDSPGTVSPALSRAKQDNTLLQIRVEENGFIRPKKFQSGFTVSAFFTLISTTHNLATDDVIKAQVTIPSTLGNGNKYRLELMPSDDEECMELLIGNIDAWPLDKGRCIVDVVVCRHRQVRLVFSIVYSLLISF